MSLLERRTPTYLGIQDGRILTRVCCADFGCVISLHILGPLPNFCLIHIKGGISGSCPDSCCVSAMRHWGFNFAEMQALRRDSDRTAIVFPKYLFCLCSQSNSWNCPLENQSSAQSPDRVRDFVPNFFFRGAFGHTNAWETHLF